MKSNYIMLIKSRKIIIIINELIVVKFVLNEIIYLTILFIDIICKPDEEN